MKRKYSHIIFDLDGVVYRGHTQIQGVPSAISRLRSAGIRISFLTNNATRSRIQLQKRLASMGIIAKLGDIMTSAFAASAYLKTIKPKPKSLYVIGERGLRNELRSAGFSVLPFKIRGEKDSTTTFAHLSKSETRPSATVLLTGLDRNVNYTKLACALDVLHAGAKWVACNLDPTLPMERGAHPGSGSIAASLAYAAGKVKIDNKRCTKTNASAQPHASLPFSASFSNIELREPDIVVGKPNTYMLELICREFGRGKKGKGRQRSACPKNEILFVGDRLDMDIAFANSAGLDSMLVLSGVAKEKEAKRAKGALRPNFILRSAADLPKWLGL